MDKEEWIEKQLKAYRAKLEKEFDRYEERDRLARAWIEENKDIDPDLCVVLEFTLDRMMLTEDGDKRRRSWQSVRALFKGVEGYPIRRGRE
jgi:hypothetical protein